MSELLTDQTFVCRSYRFADLPFFGQSFYRSSEEKRNLRFPISLRLLIKKFISKDEFRIFDTTLFQVTSPMNMNFLPFQVPENTKIEKKFYAKTFYSTEYYGYIYILNH
ncbi:hypothetical protein BpHYR1_051559 [Brachionus plicatilis]|uniref:Uncharacterized protein n=1 Tax=Brachionus plicatilis TaxID=10195 RepID=A0A3M7RLX9_BRAPC|nr:hypothetical protein BpHYR1_051559 [Brachionus plicatilis]